MYVVMGFFMKLCTEIVTVFLLFKCICFY